MIDDYPSAAVGEFEPPPKSVTDEAGRSIEIRRRRDEDGEELVGMYRAFDPADRAQGIPPVGESAIRDWLTSIQDGGAMGVVAWNETRAVGHAILVPDDDESYELAIFVLHDYQGAGIGTELLQALFGAAQDSGIEKVWLTVERWNDPAIRLYRKVGFEIVESERFEVEMTIRL